MDNKKHRGHGGRDSDSQSESHEDRHNSRRRPREEGSSSDSASPLEEPCGKVHRSDRSAGEGSSRSAGERSSRSAGEGSSRSHQNDSQAAGEGTSRDLGDGRHTSFRTPRENTGSRNNGDGPATARRNRYEIIESKPKSISTKQGSSGIQVKLAANYFKVLKVPEWNIYQYHVDFIPSIESNRLKQGILSNFKNMLGGYLFDGTQLYIARRLTEDRTELRATSRQNEEYMIVIKYVGIITMTQWQSLQVLNLILRRAMQGLKLQLIGKNFYDALAKIELRQFNLQLWPGYITSIRQHEQDILVCAEISHKYMRTETLYDILKHSGREGGDWQEGFRRRVIGMVVLTDYNNRTYRINDVDFSSSPKTTFDMKGVPKSYVDYYMMKYQIRIRDERQPLLVSENKENRARPGQINVVQLIPELCRATGLTEDMKKDQNLKRRLANTTRPDPRSRVSSLIEFNNRLQGTVESQQILRDWNLRLDRSLVEIIGRTFGPESIVLKNKIKFTATVNADWGDLLKNEKMHTSVPLKNWAVVVPNNLVHDTRDFMDKVISVSRPMGIEINLPNFCVIQDDRAGSYQRELDRVADRDPQLIMIVIHNNVADKYSIIKKKCCIDKPVPSQVVTKRAITNKSRTIATKVVIQLNAKLGGVPWSISIPLSNIMFVGFDICKSKIDRNVAYAAFVATMNPKTSTDYFSTVIKCNANDSLSNHLTLGIIKALHAFKNNTGALPSKILFYRTSVGDGSIQQVLEHEVKNLVERLEAMFMSSNLEKPKITFVMVSKSINTRFFADAHRAATNPNPGTVIDNVVTLPERYDFYLVSQSTRQGTASPTSYNVLYDTFNLPPDQLQLLTYKLCHLYYNWLGTTRVPAICQYAKKLATLVGEHLNAVPHNDLEKFLYFI